MCGNQQFHEPNGAIVYTNCTQTGIFFFYRFPFALAHTSTYPVPSRALPLRSQRNVTGKSPSSIWHEIAARIPSFSIFVIDWMGMIFGGTTGWSAIDRRPHNNNKRNGNIYGREKRRIKIVYRIV